MKCLNGPHILQFSNTLHYVMLQCFTMLRKGRIIEASSNIALSGVCCLQNVLSVTVCWKPGTLFKWSEISPHYVVESMGLFHHMTDQCRHEESRPAQRPGSRVSWKVSVRSQNLSENYRVLFPEMVTHLTGVRRSPECTMEYGVSVRRAWVRRGSDRTQLTLSSWAHVTCWWAQVPGPDIKLTSLLTHLSYLAK